MCSNEREPLGRLRDAVAALAAEDVDGLPEATLTASLPELRRLADGVEAQWLRRLEAFDRRGGAAAAGAVSTGAWVRSACRLAPSTARGRVELARALAGLPDTAAALAAGDISPSHARLVAAALAELAEAGSPELAAQTEPALVDLARALDPTKLRSALDHVRHALAPEADADAAERAYERRGLSASQTLGGVVALDGTLDPEGGALLLAALQPLAAPTGEEDRRTPRQRRADALVELARRQLDHGDLPTTGGERPHMTVLVPLDTLLRHPGTPPADTNPGPARPDTHPSTPTGPASTRPTQYPGQPAGAGHPDPHGNSHGAAPAPATSAVPTQPPTADNAAAQSEPAGTAPGSGSTARAAWTGSGQHPTSDRTADVLDPTAQPAASAGPAATPADATAVRKPAESADATTAPDPEAGTSAFVPATTPADVTATRGAAENASAATAPGPEPNAPADVPATPAGAAEPSAVRWPPPSPPVGGPCASTSGGEHRPPRLPVFGPRAP